MNYEEILIDTFSIIGIAVRTNNRDNQAQRDISQLWGRFILENIAGTIPNKISDEIYCAYTDYENDHTGDYTTILGCAVSGTQNIPENMIAIDISKSNYLKFISEGKLPESVAQTWENIWQTDYNRSYLTDFDVYGISAQNPDNAIVATYLSIK